MNVDTDALVRRILEQQPDVSVCCESSPNRRRTLKLLRHGDYWYATLTVRGVRVCEAVGTTHECFMRSNGTRHLLWIRSCCFEISTEEFRLIRSRLPMMPVSQ